MDAKKSIINHKIDTKILGTSILFFIIILLFSASMLLFLINKTADTLNRESLYDDYAKGLLQTSDRLTYLVYNFVIVGDIEYYKEYINEIDVLKSREKYVEHLLELGVTEEEEEIIKQTLSLSNDLAIIEKKALNLVLLNETDEAQNLIYSSLYSQYKSKINSNYKKLKEGVNYRVDKETNVALRFTYISFIITTIVVIGTGISTVLLLFSIFRIKAESDIDQLTGLQNRNRYKEKIDAIIKNNPTKYGALIFCDIDNLKFINDCYGHNNGDRYIQAVANSLKIFEEYESVLARPSGDEFVVYIHGFESKEELVKVIKNKINSARNSYFITSLHIEERIRFSTGVALYLSDAENVEDLIKFSDYTMFKIKKSAKGELAFYDKATMDKSAFLARNKGYLDEFLEKELVDFAMQPIVFADTFEIYGYEALMRPRIDIINSPYLLLELAKEESKLDKIERLVLKKMLEKINDNYDKLKNYKIFVNSIADQVLSNDEFEEYIIKYPEVLKSVIIEVTEQEYVDEQILKNKTQMFKEYGALIALDDYGTGYSNDVSLLSGVYDIVKIDMSIIRNIDTDIQRQEIVKSILNLSKIGNYKVLAEGVETAGEVQFLRKFGVDYMQGYFFGKPDLEVKDINESALELL